MDKLPNKVCVIHNIISPIRTYLFTEMAQWYQERGIECKVIFLKTSESNRQWKVNELPFNYTILDQPALELGTKDTYTLHTGTQILQELKSYQPDEIICFGWDHLSAYLAQSWARKHGRKFTLWSGSTLSQISWRRNITKPLIKWFLQRCDKFIVYGTQSKAYLESLGIAAKKITIFYNSVDTSAFQQRCQNITTAEKETLRKDLHITTSKVLLFNGQLIERKGIFDLLEAFKALQTNATLLIIGNGQARAELEQRIQKQNIKNIILTGFIPYNKLPLYYAIADALVLPSHEEVWGLVINEALACNLPVITTNVVGASADLVQRGKNGIIVPPHDIPALTEALQTILTISLPNLSTINQGILEYTSVSASLARNILQ